MGRESIEALSPYTKGLLTGVAEELGLERITVTSTIRTPRAQAEAMYNNIASGRLIRYASAGQKVTNLCLKMLGRKESREATISAMQELIEKLSEQGQRVSRHCVSEEEYAKRNIVDVSKSLLYDKAAKFMKELTDTEAVVRIIQPVGGRIQHDKISYDSSEPAIHIEIVIPEEYR